MARSSQLTIKIAGDAGQLKKTFAETQRAATKFGAHMEGTSRRTGSALMGLAKTSVALAGVGGLGAIVKTSVDFDKSMRNVNSIAQLSEKQLGSLQKQVLSLAGETAQAPKTLAEGLYDLVSSGFDAKESMVVLASAAKAATAGLTTTEVSTKAVAAVLNAYHRPAKDAANVSDVLFQTVNKGVISFEQLSTTIGDVLPFASSLGVGLGQLGGAIATMTKAGISPEETMTRIKNVMVAMLKPSDALAIAIKKTGASSGEALIKQKGFQGALEALIGTTDGTKGAVAKLFPNIRALGGALALTGKNAKGARDDLKSFKDVTGATDAALKEQSKSIAHQWEHIKSVLASIAIQAGSVLVPAVSKGLEGLGHLFGKAAHGFEKLKKQYENLTGGGDKKKLSAFDMHHHFAGMLKPEKSPLGAIGTMVQQGFEKIDWTAIGGTLGAGMTKAFEGLGKLAPALQKGLSAAVDQINGAELLSKLVKTAAQAFGALFDPAWWIKNFTSVLALFPFAKLGKLLKIPGLSQLWDHILAPIARGAGKLTLTLAKVFGRAGSHGVTAFLGEIEKVAPKLAHVLLGIVTGAGGILGRLTGVFRRVAGRAGKAIVSGIESGASAIGRVVGRLAGKVLGPLEGLVGRAASAAGRVGSAIVSGIAAAIRAAAGSIGSAITSIIPGPLKSAAKKVLGIFGQAGGMVPGTGRGDIVPAMLEPGEFIIRRRVVERFGPTFFAGINEAEGFAKGGKVKKKKVPGLSFRQTRVGHAGRPSMLDTLETMAAEAALTESPYDDLDVARRLEAYWKRRYAQAKRSGRASTIKVAAEGLKGAQDTLAGLLPAVSVPETQAEALARIGVGDTAGAGGTDTTAADLLAAQQATNELLASLRDEIAKQNNFATSVMGVTSREAIRAFADVISGQIVGYGYGPRAASAGSGTGSRY